MRTRPPSRAGLPAAGLARRLEAFALDRLLGWGAVVLGWWVAGAPTPATPAGVLLGVLVLTAVVEVALAVPLGLRGVSPGGAARGLRLVHPATADPIGLGPALARAAIAALALLPTAGLGAAALAWSAVTDPGRRRRGWHDRWTGAVLVDERMATPPEPDDAERPAGLVNLTAARLAPGPEVRAWRVRFDDGEELRIEGPALVGRRPEGRPGEEVRHLVALADPALSKTHLRFHPRPDGVLLLLDRGSTNGSVLLRRGDTLGLEPFRPTRLVAGDVVRVGDQRLAVHRDA